MCHGRDVEEEKERIKEKRAGPRKPKGKEDSIGQISSFSFPLLVIEDISPYEHRLIFLPNTKK